MFLDYNNGPLKTKRYQLVEVPVPAKTYGVGNQIKIQDQPQLRTLLDKRVIVRALEVFSVEAVPISPAGNPVVSGTIMAGSYLTLNVDGFENLYQIPLTRLNRVYADTGAGFIPYVDTDFRLWEIAGIDWTKSYFTLTNAGVVATPFSFLLGVYYDWYPNDFQKVSAPI